MAIPSIIFFISEKWNRQIPDSFTPVAAHELAHGHADVDDIVHKWTDALFFKIRLHQVRQDATTRPSLQVHENTDIPN
ncbi:MAG: hypothetical protein ACTSW4_03895 [Candidatus Ranarchaeia archaeon]